jgi:hypothetical protein
MACLDAPVCTLPTTHTTLSSVVIIVPNKRTHSAPGQAGERLEVQVLCPVRSSEPPGPRVMGVCSRGQGLSVARTEQKDRHFVLVSPMLSPIAKEYTHDQSPFHPCQLGRHTLVPLNQLKDTHFVCQFAPLRLCFLQVFDGQAYCFN